VLKRSTQYLGPYRGRCIGEGYVMFSFLHNKIKRSNESPEKVSEDTIVFHKLSESAVIPTKRHASDAGYDLSSTIDLNLKSGSNHLFNTNIRVELPIGYCGTIYGRSGLALHNSITAHPGIIDQGYTGDLGVILFNLGKENYVIRKGDRIAQLVVVKVWQPLDLDGQTQGETREKLGFGSTGE
jgi:dUTP pyrophosphatase